MAANEEGIKYEVRIKSDITNIYRDSSKSTIIGWTLAGYEIIATDVSKDKKFFYCPVYEGWIEASNLTVVNTQVPEDVPEDRIRGVINSSNITTSVVDHTSNAAGSIFGNMTGSNMYGVYGLPYQFLPSVDRRLNNDISGIGRKYAEKILGRNNFLYLQPGKCSFLPGASDAERSSMINRLMSGEAGGVNGSGRYYTFELDYTGYYEYVNAACRATASLLGIENQTIEINGHNARAGSFDWRWALASQYANRVLKTSNNIVYYMDGYNSMSEDFGNSTRESSIVSQVNGLSDQVKELNYLLGISTDESLFGNMQEDNELFSTTTTALKEMTSNFTKGTGVLNAILGNQDTILSGGKIVFPELWSDSDYDRSYNIDIKLRSPDADEMSIYLNILVPYIHLMAMTAPRDIGKDSVNGYKAPFLVRAFVRSMFNIDLGIITSLSVTKGGEGNWAVATNLPTSIDISLSIKDLYKSLFISDNAIRFVLNDAELEHLMALAGVDYYDISAFQRANLAGVLLGGSITSIPTAIKSRITDYIDTALRPFIFNY